MSFNQLMLSREYEIIKTHFVVVGGCVVGALVVWVGGGRAGVGAGA